MLRKILFCLFLFIVFVIAGITIFLMTFDLNNYKKLIEEKISAALQRPVTVESMEMKLAFVPTVKIQNLQIGNPEGIKASEPFFKIKQMEAVLELVPLLTSNVNIHQVTIQAAELNLVNNGTVNNWTFAKSEKESSGDSSKSQKASKMPKVRLDTIGLDQLTISYQDGQQKKEFVLNKLALKDFHVLNGTLVYNGTDIGLDINVGRLEDFIAQKSNFPIDAKILVNRAMLHLNGKIGELKDFSRMKMTLSVNVPNADSFSHDLGMAYKFIPSKPVALNAVLEGNLKSLLIKQMELTVASQKSFSLTGKGKMGNILTDPNLSLTCQVALNDDALSALWGIQNFTAEFKLGASKKRIEITQLQIESNRSDITLNGSWIIQQPPKLDLILSSNYLSVSDLLRTEGDKAKQGKKVASAQTNKKDDFPWDLLRKFDASVQVNIRNFVVPDDIKGYVRLQGSGTLEKGHLKWPFEVDILNGTVKGMAELDASKQNISLQLQGRSLKLDDVRALNKDIQDVQLDMDVSLKTNGMTYQALLSQVTGQIVAELSNGYIINDWFVQLPNTLSLLQKQKTGITNSKPVARVPLVCGAANLDVKMGVIQSNKQLAVETDVLNFVVDGQADLSRKTLSVSMQPSVNQANNKVNAALMATQVVQISGPFSNLTPSVNPTKAVGGLLQAGARAVSSNNTASQPKALCTAALKGYKLNKPKSSNNAKVTATKKTEKAAAPVTQKKETKKEFKQQLMDSLSQALQAQAGAQGAH